MKITDKNIAVLELDTHISRWVEEKGTLDHANYVATFQNYLQAGCVAIDVGAFIGDTTYAMAKLVGPHGMVYAYEPNPQAFACLAYNMRNFPQVKCFPYAVGAQDFHPEVRRLGLADNQGASHLLNGDTQGIPVVSTSLDMHLGPEFPPVNFIKVDVEGLEMEVLNGAYDLIRLRRPVLFIETATHARRFHYTRNNLYTHLKQEFNYRITPDFVPEEQSPQYDLVAIYYANKDTETEEREAPGINTGRGEGEVNHTGESQEPEATA